MNVLDLRTSFCGRIGFQLHEISSLLNCAAYYFHTNSWLGRVANPPLQIKIFFFFTCRWRGRLASSHICPLGLMKGDVFEVVGALHFLFATIGGDKTLGSG